MPRSLRRHSSDRARQLRRSAEWFSDGLTLRREARRKQRCVECFRPLGSARTPYCSVGCRRKFSGHYFWNAARSVVLRRDRYTCQWCGRRFLSRELDVDHIVELALGGASLEYANLQTLCKSCHRRKTGRFLQQRARLKGIPVPHGSGQLDLDPTLEVDFDWFPA